MIWSQQVSKFFKKNINHGKFTNMVWIHIVSVLWQEEGYPKYSLSLRQILKAMTKGFPKGSGYIWLYPDSTHTTYILNYKSSIDLPRRSILEDLILHIALTAWNYGKILPSRLSNTREINFNIIMFSNWEWYIHMIKSQSIGGPWTWLKYLTH